jgi:plasmid replication initiation protein
MNAHSDLVKISNELVRAIQRLTLNEKRLLMLGLTKLETRSGIHQTISIKASEFASTYGVVPTNAYKTLSDSKSKLWDRETIINGHTVRWLITHKHIEQAGSLLLRFHPDLEPHVLDLKTRFTQYLLSRAAEFSHVYSWRLFELLMQFKKTGLLNISVDEFKSVLEVPEAYNKDFGLIRSKVINIALKEIKEKAGLPTKMTVEKEGRKVKALKFTFPTEQQTALPIAEKPLKTPTTARTKKTEPDAPSERQRSAEAQGIAQLEALARQHGIEIPKAKKMN